MTVCASSPTTAAEKALRDGHGRITAEVSARRGRRVRATPGFVLAALARHEEDWPARRVAEIRIWLKRASSSTVIRKRVAIRVSESPARTVYRMVDGCGSGRDGGNGLEPAGGDLDAGLEAGADVPSGPTGPRRRETAAPPRRRVTAAAGVGSARISPSALSSRPTPLPWPEPGPPAARGRRRRGRREPVPSAAARSAGGR